MNTMDKKEYSALMEDLRHRAEGLSKNKQSPMSDQIDELLPEKVDLILHELEVHQIELELQNEELRCAQLELEHVRARYFDLYDLAPVGYFTLGENGVILEANLMAAILLDLDRKLLSGKPIHEFVADEDQDIYYFHCKQLLET